MDNNTTAPTGATIGSVGTYVPPKDWDDITDAEKIERMREVIKNLNYSVSRAQSDIHELKQAFKNHTHTDKGVHVPYNEYNNSNSIGIGAQLSNAKYF